MPKISIGNDYGHARTTVLVEFPQSSEMELTIGDAHDMSSRQITLIERDHATVNSEVVQLKTLVAALVAAGHPGAVAVQTQANLLTQNVAKVVDERKWYDVSGAGLLEAAKAVGAAAVPIARSALKVIQLLRSASIV